MITISLNQLQFYSYHGLHAEEKLLGNQFEVSLAISIDKEENIESLDQTVDYASVFELIKECMEKPTELLETVAQQMAFQINEKYKQVKSIDITITKKNPPIATMEGEVGVNYKKEF